MSTDDTMRRIEECIQRVIRDVDTIRLSTSTEALRSTIRAALQPDDAEHERAVEEWVQSIEMCKIRSLQTVSGFPVHFIPKDVLDDALRLMRRQPKETTDGK